MSASLKTEWLKVVQIREKLVIRRNRKRQSHSTPVADIVLPHFGPCFFNLRRCLSTLSVGMPFESQFAVRFRDLLFRGICLNAQFLVAILCFWCAQKWLENDERDCKRFHLFDVHCDQWLRLRESGFLAVPWVSDVFLIQIEKQWKNNNAAISNQIVVGLLWWCWNTLSVERIRGSPTMNCTFFYCSCVPSYGSFALEMPWCAYASLLELAKSCILHVVDVFLRWRWWRSTRMWERFLFEVTNELQHFHGLVTFNILHGLSDVSIPFSID